MCSSIISAAFAPSERGTAIGIWAGVAGSALAIGPLLGGLLTEHLGWSWIFFVNVPVEVLALSPRSSSSSSRARAKRSSAWICPASSPRPPVSSPSSTH